MHENRRAKFFRCGEEWCECGIVQVSAVDIRSDLHSRKSKLLHAALQLARGKRSILHWDSPQRNESIGHRTHNFRKVIVEQLR